jgi:hypothetical protein
MIISEKQIMQLIIYIMQISIVGSKGITMKRAMMLIEEITLQQSEELKVIE